MFPYHVGLAIRTCRGHTGYALSFEDGTTSNFLLDGAPEGHTAHVMEEILKTTGLERQIVITTRSKTFIATGKTITGIFPSVVVMAPYDHASEEVYRLAREVMDQIEFPEPDVIEIAADASVSSTRAVWAWVRRRSSGEFEFSFGACPVADSNVAEMLAIIHAGVQGKSNRPIKIYSDSRNAIKALSFALENGGGTPEVLRTRGKKNLPVYMSMLAERHNAGLLEMEWVKGHSDHSLNILADQIATYVRRRMRSESDTKVIRQEISEFIDAFQRNGTVQFV